jgi:membrane carboxypeptidase/penicillin-binding protein
MIPAFATLFSFIMPKLAPGPAPATAAGGLPEPFAGVPGSIGGDESAWFSGYAGDTVTSVALWDESARHGQLVMGSLAGLGGVPAAHTTAWPAAIWDRYMKAVTPGGPFFAAWKPQTASAG